ncbi:unnamed protein product [Mytilus edulis]|uniref:DZIP3-like HEPN domain-containing protein n=1 Tax=Mytilus edulis TaxID=6550 RepID=A0A8S3PUJ0_MYTED|nr:unnamed protein product [Mytilus edulis]
MRMTGSQTQNPFSDSVPDDPKSKTFDITLMITLLRNIKNITNHQGAFGCLPTAMETTPGTDLGRIEYYRNYLAIGRLGGQKIKQDCDHLRIRTLDQTNKEIIEDIKCSNDEIKNLKESLNTLKIYHELLLEGDHRELKRSYEELQEDHTEMTDEIKRLKTSYDDTVPCNIRGKFEIIFMTCVLYIEKNEG